MRMSMSKTISRAAFGLYVNAPKLQVDCTLHTDLRHIAVVKKRVCYAGDDEEKQAGCDE